MSSLPILLVKLSLSPTLILAVSLVERRWGPTISGWIIGLPLSAAPIVFIITLEQGSSFGSETAQSTMLGIAAVSTFCITYFVGSRRFDWFGSLLMGWMGFFASLILLDQITNPPVLLAYLGVVAYTTLIFRRIPSVKNISARMRRPSWEIPLRMAATVGLVLLVTGIAPYLGPQLSGLITPFPVFTSIFVFFLHKMYGLTFAVQLLRALALGLNSSAIFFLVLSYTLQPWGLIPAFSLAVAASMIVHGLSLRLLNRP